MLTSSAVTKKAEAAERLLEQKDAEIAQERERRQVLANKLREAQDSATRFQELMSQNKSIFDKLGEQMKVEAQSGRQLETQVREG